MAEMKHLYYRQNKEIDDFDNKLNEIEEKYMETIADLTEKKQELYREREKNRLVMSELKSARGVSSVVMKKYNSLARKDKEAVEKKLEVILKKYKTNEDAKIYSDEEEELLMAFEYILRKNIQTQTLDRSRIIKGLAGSARTVEEALSNFVSFLLVLVNKKEKRGRQEEIEKFN